MDELIDAVRADLGKVSLRIQYSGEGKTERTITPLVMLYHREWGVFAYCHMREAARWFKFSSIECVDPIPLVRTFPPGEVAHMICKATPTLRKAVLRAVGVEDRERRTTQQLERLKAQQEEQELIAKAREKWFEAYPEAREFFETGIKAPIVPGSSYNCTREQLEQGSKDYRDRLAFFLEHRNVGETEEQFWIRQGVPPGMTPEQYWGAYRYKKNGS